MNNLEELPSKEIDLSQKTTQSNCSKYSKRIKIPNRKYKLDNEDSFKLKKKVKAIKKKKQKNNY